MTSAALTALAIGIALASAPGPVHAVLVTEAARGGMGRGLRTLAGVHLTFGAMLVCLALGLSVAVPRGLGLRVLKVAGGVLLLWLAVDSLRARGQAEQVAGHRRTLPPSVRGVLAIVLNPGGWLFLAAVASPLFATAAERGGTTSALVAAGMLVAGAALGDLGLVLVASLGLRFAGERVVSCRAGRGACRAGGMAATQRGAPVGLSGSRTNRTPPTPQGGWWSRATGALPSGRSPRPRQTAAVGSFVAAPCSSSAAAGSAGRTRTAKCSGRSRAPAAVTRGMR